MRKSLGDKRKELTTSAIDDVVGLVDELPDAERGEGGRVRILPNEAFGFQRITVGRPVRRRWVVSAETLDVLSDEAKAVYTPLITAAVTGEFDVSTASGRRAPT